MHLNGRLSLAPAWCAEVQLWTFRHDPARIDHAQTRVIVQLALVDVASGGDVRQLIERPCVGPKCGVLIDVTQVALEQTVVDRIKSEQRRKQAPVSLGN